MPRRTTRHAASQEDQDNSENVAMVENNVQEDSQLAGSGDETVPEQTTKRSKVAVSKVHSKVKKEKVTKARTRHDASDNEMEMDFAAPFDKNEFLSTFHPIPSKGTYTIGGIVSDFKVVSNSVKLQGFELVGETATAIEEVSGQAVEGDEINTKLDLVMRQLLDAEKELEVHKTALDEIKQDVLEQNSFVDLDEIYRTKVAEATVAYNKLTTRQKYARNEIYRKFKESVWEVNHQGAMRTIKDMLPREEGDSDSGSDIEVGGMTQTYKCPLTFMYFTNPVTSVTCGHSFSADAIREYIQSGRGRNRCPATGCNQVLTMDDIKPDEQLARRTANALRRAQRREEQIEEDEAEVVDE